MQVSLALMRWTYISPYSLLQVSSYRGSLSGFGIANSTSIGQLVSEGKASDAILTPIPCVLNVECGILRARSEEIEQEYKKLV